MVADSRCIRTMQGLTLHSLRLPAPARWRVGHADTVPLCSLLRRHFLSRGLWNQQRYFSQRSSTSLLKVCVVGSGPAGFYTAHQLIKVCEKMQQSLTSAMVGLKRKNYRVPQGSWLSQYRVHPGITLCI